MSFHFDYEKSVPVGLPDHALDNMIARQLQPHIMMPPILTKALGTVRRQPFVPALYRNHCHGDANIPLHNPGTPRFLLAPLTLGRLLQRVALKTDQQQESKILILAGGKGYSTALTSEMGLISYLVENQSDLSQEASQNLKAYPNAQVYQRTDLTAGLPEHSPFDIIFIDGGAVSEIPPELIKQLKENGFILALLKRSLVEAEKIALCWGVKLWANGTKEILFDGFAPMNQDFNKPVTFDL